MLGSSIGRVASIFQTTSQQLVPISDENGAFVGMVSERGLLQAYAAGEDESHPIDPFLEPAIVLPAYATAAEAMRKMEDEAPFGLFVVDANRRLLGYLSPSDLWVPGDGILSPGIVGGMATPLGVYLTNGRLTGGASQLGLILSGLTLYLFFMVGFLVCYGAATLLPRGKEWVEVGTTIVDVGPFLVFLALMRFSPLAGIHAAEHMTVHAIERHEPLTTEVVKRMPRVHPRCGTNLAVGLSMFLTLSSVSLGPTFESLGELRILIALLVSATLWRRVGGFVQYWITTKKPTDKQIEMGIRAGKELLERYQQSPLGPTNGWQRLWYSGIAFVIAGSLIGQAIGWIVRELTHIPMPL